MYFFLAKKYPKTETEKKLLQNWWLCVHLPQTTPPPPLPQKKKKTEPHNVLVPKNTFKDVFDNTGDLDDFRAHIFCPQSTQELLKKHNEGGPPEQLPTDQGF